MKSSQVIDVMKRKIAITIAFVLMYVFAAAPAAFAQAAAKAAPQAAGHQSPVAPTKEQVQDAVNEAFKKFKSNTEGKNADYIPELAKVDPNLYGIAIVTADGQTITAGDVDKAFSIQSISKVFTLALAMEELGPDKVFDKR